MQESQGIRRYQETDLGSVSPEKLVVMAYEALVRHMEKAAATATERPAEALHAAGLAQGIISELRCALDHEIGGEIAANLDSLYDYMFDQNLSFLVDRDPAHPRNNLRVLAPLLDAWRRIPPGTAARAARERAAESRATPPAGPDPASAPPTKAPGRQPAQAAAGASDGDREAPAPARSFSYSA